MTRRAARRRDAEAPKRQRRRDAEAPKRQRRRDAGPGRSYRSAPFSVPVTAGTDGSTTMQATRRSALTSQSSRIG